MTQQAKKKGKKWPFSIKNLYNRTAWYMGTFSALTAYAAVHTAWAMNHTPDLLAQVAGELASPLPFAYTVLTYAGAAAFGLWNAHSMGGKTVMFNRAAFNIPRNLAFVSTSCAGAALFVGVTLANFGLGNVPAIALATLAGGLALRSNIRGLKWLPEGEARINPKMANVKFTPLAAEDTAPISTLKAPNHKGSDGYSHPLLRPRSFKN